MIEDELLEVLNKSGTDELLQPTLQSAKLLQQDLSNTNAAPDYTQSPEEMQKQGKIWDGYRWI